MKREKCIDCEWFDWEDELPYCTFGINDIQDIDDFNQITIHEKDRCSLPTIEIQIRFNGPENANDLDSIYNNIVWLCPENIRLVLKKECRNTGFKVEYSPRFQKKLNKMRTQLSKGGEE